MASAAVGKSKTECDEIAVKQLRDSLKMVAMEIRNFNSEFTQFLDEQKKQTRELWTLVTRYNVLCS
jgi:hypothetical protein